MYRRGLACGSPRRVDSGSAGWHRQVHRSEAGIGVALSTLWLNRIVAVPAEARGPRLAVAGAHASQTPSFRRREPAAAEQRG